jgi:hypothetical protein
MQFPWEIFDYLQSFFRLDFLFSGLEVNTTMVFMARLAALIFFGGGALYALFRLSLKLLECAQTLLSSLGSLPAAFYLLVLLVIPLSPNSLISDWMGYILLTISLFGLATMAIASFILWKYGMESLVGLIRTMSRDREKELETPERKLMDPDNVVHTTVHEPVVASPGP